MTHIMQPFRIFNSLMYYIYLYIVIIMKSLDMIELSQYAV